MGIGEKSAETQMQKVAEEGPPPEAIETEAVPQTVPEGATNPEVENILRTTITTSQTAPPGPAEGAEEEAIVKTMLTTSTTSQTAPGPAEGAEEEAIVETMLTTSTTSQTAPGPMEGVEKEAMVETMPSTTSFATCASKEGGAEGDIVDKRKSPAPCEFGEEELAEAWKDYKRKTFQKASPSNILTRAQKILQSSLNKTVMCVFNARGPGMCLKGNSCSFAHARSQLVECPNLQKTSMCWKLTRYGYCEGSGGEGEEKCKFAHSVKELYGTAAFYKTKLCRYALPNRGKNSKKCVSGDTCRYAHSLEELNAAEDTLRGNVGRYSPHHKYAQHSHSRLPSGYHSTSPPHRALYECTLPAPTTCKRYGEYEHVTTRHHQPVSFFRPNISPRGGQKEAEDGMRASGQGDGLKKRVIGHAARAPSPDAPPASGLKAPSGGHIYRQMHIYRPMHLPYTVGKKFEGKKGGVAAEDDGSGREKVDRIPLGRALARSKGLSGVLQKRSASRVMGEEGVAAENNDGDCGARIWGGDEQARQPQCQSLGRASASKKPQDSGGDRRVLVEKHEEEVRRGDQDRMGTLKEAKFNEMDGENGHLKEREKNDVLQEENRRSVSGRKEEKEGSHRQEHLHASQSGKSLMREHNSAEGTTTTTTTLGDADDHDAQKEEGHVIWEEEKEEEKRGGVGGRQRVGKGWPRVEEGAGKHTDSDGRYGNGEYNNTTVAGGGNVIWEEENEELKKKRGGEKDEKRKGAQSVVEEGGGAGKHSEISETSRGYGNGSTRHNASQPQGYSQTSRHNNSLNINNHVHTHHRHHDDTRAPITKRSTHQSNNEDYDGPYSTNGWNEALVEVSVSCWEEEKEELKKKKGGQRRVGKGWPRVKGAGAGKYKDSDSRGYGNGEHNNINTTPCWKGSSVSVVEEGGSGGRTFFYTHTRNKESMEQWNSIPQNSLNTHDDRQPITKRSYLHSNNEDYDGPYSTNGWNNDVTPRHPTNGAALVLEQEQQHVRRMREKGKGKCVAYGDGVMAYGAESFLTEGYHHHHSHSTPTPVTIGPTPWFPFDSTTTPPAVIMGVMTSHPFHAPPPQPCFTTMCPASTLTPPFMSPTPTLTPHEDDESTVKAVDDANDRAMMTRSAKKDSSIIVHNDGRVLGEEKNNRLLPLGEEASGEQPPLCGPRGVDHRTLPALVDLIAPPRIMPMLPTLTPCPPETGNDTAAYATGSIIFPQSPVVHHLPFEPTLSPSFFSFPYFPYFPMMVGGYGVGVGVPIYDSHPIWSYHSTCTPVYHHHDSLFPALSPGLTPGLTPVGHTPAAFVAGHYDAATGTTSGAQRDGTETPPLDAAFYAACEPSYREEAAFYAAIGNDRGDSKNGPDSVSVQKKDVYGDAVPRIGCPNSSSTFLALDEVHKMGAQLTASTQDRTQRSKQHKEDDIEHEDDEGQSDHDSYYSAVSYSTEGVLAEPNSIGGKW